MRARSLICLGLALTCLMAACGGRGPVGPAASNGAQSPSPSPPLNGDAGPTTQPSGANCARTSTGLIPLTDLGAGVYRGQQGGLYPGGSNSPPAEYAALGAARAGEVRPLNARGEPDPLGRIGLLSIGMSNATQEFSAFKREADSDPAKSPAVVIVDGAQGGKDAEMI